MKVYLVYCKDGFGGTEVDKVFLSHEKACQYVIQKEFRGNSYYDKFTETELMHQAEAFVSVEEVVE